MAQAGRPFLLIGLRFLLSALLIFFSRAPGKFRYRSVPLLLPFVTHFSSP